MAVIRQNTQVFNQPIGVVRANAGASQIGNAIVEASSRISSLAYRRGAIEAEKAGEKAGIAQPSSKIVAINPETGLPEAYQAPAGFGRIASDSYQSMIDRRFEDSVIDEIKVRGQEIAADSGSADSFRSRMTSYIEQMYANAVDSGGELNAYGRLIEEAGTAYVTSTYTALRNKEIAAAKKALQRQQKYELWMKDREIGAAIDAGANFEDVMPLINNKEQRANDLFFSGSMSFSSYKSEIENVEGYRALAANRELVGTYASMTPFQRSQFKVGLQDPAVLADLAANTQNPNLEKLTLMSLTETSVSSLITSLDSFASAKSEYEENLVDAAVADFGVSVFTTTSDIREASLQFEDPQDQLKFFGDIASQMVLNKADMSIEDVSDMDVLSNELLKSSGMDRSALEQIIGEDATRAVFSMSAEQRAALESELVDRRQSFNRVGTEQSRQRINSLGAEIRSIMESDDPQQGFISMTAKINAADIDPSQKNELDGVLSRVAAKRFSELADEIDPGSVASFEAVANAVRSNNPSGLNAEQKSLFDLYRPAYELQEASTEGAMSRRLTGLRGLQQQITNDAVNAGLSAKLSQRKALLPDELELVDKNFLADVQTVSDIINSPNAMAVMQSGTFTPKIKAILSSALGSTSAEDISAATELWEQFSKVVGQTEFGENINIDLMRRNLSPETYASYAAASYAGRKLNVSPTAVINGIQNYEDGVAGIDSAIKKRLNVAQSKPLSAVLDEYSMSPNYKLEVLSMLRIMEAMGQNVTEDTIDGWIQDYNDKSVKDDSIVGFKVGDRTVYGLRNYLSTGEIINHRNELTDLMAQDENLAPLLKGGTVADAVIANSLSALFPSILGRSEALVQEFRRAWDASADLNDQDRLRAGLSALNIELKYKPNLAGFSKGIPSWFVGYEQDGMFQMIELNDEPYMLEKQTDSADSPRANAYNQLVVAVNSGADNENIARLTINYWATLDHMSESWLLANPSELRKVNMMLPERNAIELFKAAREGNE